ncbi:hypothetical protein RA210_U520003 [Rubrivivax sp. A210]|nr:hypothetical protein RA210_U520003 [Rubrivivax sp. A210]
MVRGTFSPARSWRPTVGARLARTLGRRIRPPTFRGFDTHASTSKTHPQRDRTIVIAREGWKYPGAGCI